MTGAIQNAISKKNEVAKSGNTMQAYIKKWRVK